MRQARKQAHRLLAVVVALVALQGVNGEASFARARGGVLAYTDYAPPQPHVTVARRDGSDPHVLPTPCDAWEPNWSPTSPNLLYMSFGQDGSACTSNEADLFVWSFRTGTYRQLTFTSDWQESQGRFSPDGSHIAYISDEGWPDQSRDIWVMAADGSHKVQLTSWPGYEVAPRWSPDGRHISFASDHAGNWDVWVMNADGTSKRQLTFTPENEGAIAATGGPTWSQDGRRLIYESDKAGNFDLWMMNADGSAKRQLTDHPAFDAHPFWASDRYVYFNSDRDGTLHVYRLNLRTRTTQLITDPQFQQERPDLRRHGKYRR